MTNWHTVTMADVPGLHDAIVSAVEMRSDYGRREPDWDAVLDDVESSSKGLDLGTYLLSEPVKAILADARKVYRELRAS
jgi:hypothetical protein